MPAAVIRDDGLPAPHSQELPVTVTQAETPRAIAPNAPTVAVVTLGCGRNEVDTDQLQGLFNIHGHTVVDEAEGADVVLVNTCTFIAPAKQESVDTVLAACDLKKSGTKAVVVVGCMAQRYPHELADSIPEADAVVGFAGYNDLPNLVDRILAGEQFDRVIVESEPQTATPTATRPRPLLPLLVMPTSVEEAPPERVPVRLMNSDADLARMPASGPRFPVRTFDSSKPWAYLKIAGGCDRVCTFCAIPSFRGSFQSRGLDELIAEAAWLSEQGARELVLVSENTTSWGKDLDSWNGNPGGRDLQSTMLRELSAVDGIERIRLLYLQPAELQWPLLEAMAELPEVVPYVDLSLQHVSSDILTSMKRSGSPERFLELIGRIRTLMPDAAFRSNLILGFPGETERHVQQIEDFLTEARLDWVGLFPFSVEDGTPSAEFEDQVPQDVAHDRVERVAALQDRIADDIAAAHVGQQVAVLVDRVEDGTGYEEAGVYGRTPQMAPDTDGEVRLELADGTIPDLPVGRTVDAVVTASEGVDLVAAPLGPVR
ncbi:MAG: ribosomal protein S12 methylthiotransferase [Nonlabens sp.]